MNSLDRNAISLVIYPVHNRKESCIVLAFMQCGKLPAIHFAPCRGEGGDDLPAPEKASVCNLNFVHIF